MATTPSIPRRPHMPRHNAKQLPCPGQAESCFLRLSEQPDCLFVVRYFNDVNFSFRTPRPVLCSPSVPFKRSR